MDVTRADIHERIYTSVRMMFRDIFIKSPKGSYALLKDERNTGNEVNSSRKRGRERERKRKRERQGGKERG